MRHLDAPPITEAVNTAISDDSASAGAAVDPAKCPGRRRLTFIYYLNAAVDAVAAKETGGQLRIHNLPAVGESCGETSYMDIEPTLGTLVVFRRCVISDAYFIIYASPHLAVFPFFPVLVA